MKVDLHVLHKVLYIKNPLATGGFTVMAFLQAKAREDREAQRGSPF